MNKLLRAIVENDRATVRKVLNRDPMIVTRLIPGATFYDSKIFHWIYRGDTALHLAAAGYRVELVELLLEVGADPNAAHNHRHSGPLHYASDGFLDNPEWDPKKQVETIQRLLDKGAKIDLQDKNGATALHRAVRTRCAAAVRYLLKSGADLTTWNKPGSTAFHLAVQNTGRGGSGSAKAMSAQRQIINDFLAFGVNPNLKCSRGKTVKDWARIAWIRELLDDSRV
jgi:hypothetical protein